MNTFTIFTRFVALEDYSKLYTRKKKIYLKADTLQELLFPDVHCTQSIVQKGKMSPVCHPQNKNKQKKKHECKQYKK